MSSYNLSQSQVSRLYFPLNLEQFDDMIRIYYDSLCTVPTYIAGAPPDRDVFSIWAMRMLFIYIRMNNFNRNRSAPFLPVAAIADSVSKLKVLVSQIPSEILAMIREIARPMLFGPNPYYPYPFWAPHLLDIDPANDLHSNGLVAGPTIGTNVPWQFNVHTRCLQWANLCGVTLSAFTMESLEYVPLAYVRGNSLYTSFDISMIRLEAVQLLRPTDEAYSTFLGFPNLCWLQQDYLRAVAIHDLSSMVQIIGNERSTNDRIFLVSNFTSVLVGTFMNTHFPSLGAIVISKGSNFQSENPRPKRKNRAKVKPKEVKETEERPPSSTD